MSRSRLGFTLVEVLLALGLLAGAAVGVIAWTGRLAEAAAEPAEILQAERVLERAKEELLRWRDDATGASLAERLRDVATQAEAGALWLVADRQGREVWAWGDPEVSEAFFGVAVELDPEAESLGAIPAYVPLRVWVFWPLAPALQRDPVRPAGARHVVEPVVLQP